MKMMIFLIYGFLFSVSFFLLAVLWHTQMAGVYFICPDKGLISDFVPPFVNTGVSGDFFIRPQRVVYIIWAVYVFCALMVPGVFAWLVARVYDRALKKSWM